MPAEPVIPSIRITRPRTSPATSRHVTARTPTGGPEEAVNSGHGGQATEHEIELLEYEWPDLPPLPSIKDAITRNRVSNGISYLLPVDKGRNSINNRFRTDLRAMFQEPYASDDLQYDDNRVKLSSKVHFLSNTGDTKWTRQHLRNIPINLNADSEKMRRLYAHSAPTGGVASRRMGIDPHKLRTRSNLYLPLKASIPPELVKLRKEVEKIIKSVKEDDEDFDEEQLLKENALLQSQSTMRLGDTINSDLQQHHHHHHHHGQHQQHQQQQQQQLPQQHHHVEAVGEGGRWRPHGAVQFHGIGGGKDGGGMTSTSLRTNPLAAKLQNIHVTPERFDTYAELKSTKPPKPQIPESVKSQYLDDQQNQNIWEWLHHGEEMNDFDFFLSVCG